MKQYSAKDARLKMREILASVEHGERVEITRWGFPIAAVVSADWLSKTDADLAELKKLRAEVKALREEY